MKQDSETKLIILNNMNVQVKIPPTIEDPTVYKESQFAYQYT